jgi:EmrB/QacA subfamily drug resistance transporter
MKLGLRGDRGPILLALMVSTGLAALDSTILATAVPSIVSDLGDFAQFPWLFSIYLLAQAVSVPIYSKLADVIGRKPILMFGIALFLVGSLACGAAWSMPVLILARGLQGLGAGAILPMTITVAGDIYTVEERSKIQGYFASIWGISSVVGPALGGVFSQFASWRWVFFINLPLGLVAVYLLVRNFREKVEHRTHKLDIAGAALLTSALSLLILATLEGGQAWAWDSWISIGCFTSGGVLLAAFLVVETRASEPVLPLWTFSRRLLLTTSLASVGFGAALIGLTSYIPTYLERTLHVPPLVAGGALAAVMVGWPIAATFSGRFYLKIGFRNTAVIGVALIVIAAAGLVAFSAAPNLFIVAGFCLVAGLGFGLGSTPTVVAAQSSVPWSERGVVTGANQFTRAVGSAVGIAVFGAVANAVFSSAPGGEQNPAVVASASGEVFWAVWIAAAVTLAAVAAMPKDRIRAETGAKETA